MYLSRTTNNDLGSYKLTDQRLKQLEEFTWHMYWAMTTPYRVRVDIPQDDKGKHWRLDLADAVKSRVPGAFVLYPWALPQCGIKQSFTAEH